jgi:hypothetical protein
MTTTTTRREFNLIAFQEKLALRLFDIRANGVGDHRQRSRGRALSKAQAELQRRGFTECQALAAVLDARDVADLRWVAEDE